MSRSICSFCGKPESDVNQLIAGPNRVAVCNECIHLFAAVTRDPFDGNVLITDIGELVTNDPQLPGLLGIIEHAAVAISGGRVAWTGPSDIVPERWRSLPTMPVGGRAVIPGFVDSHTHAHFGGDRSDDYADRLAVYADPPLVDLAPTIEATMATSRRHLVRETSDRLARMLSMGTTTVEVKSGFGYDTTDERRLLEILGDAADEVVVDVVSTLFFRGVPPGRPRDEHIRLITEELLAVCAPLANYCDVDCDDTGFAVEEAETILTAAQRHGLPNRLHAQRFGPDESISLAVKMGSVTADHLDHATRADGEALSASGTVAVLLPAASFGVRSGHAPAKMLWEAGATVAIATDCGPDAASVESMQFVVALAAVEMGLTASQAVWSATRGGALAVEEPEKGWLGRGALADLVILDAPRSNHLVQRPGTNHVWKVLKQGRVVVG